MVKNCNNSFREKNKAIAIRNNRGYQPRVEKTAAHRINDLIRGVSEVRLVGENIEPGVFKFSDALRLAEEQEVDLVEISPNAVPPVCKLMDYGKFIYEQKKRDKQLKAKSTQIVVKVPKGVTEGKITLAVLNSKLPAPTTVGAAGATETASSAVL
mgnify:CR=1 FL=1